MLRSSLCTVLLLASGAAALLPGSAALARAHPSNCSPSAGPLAPQLLAPCDHAVVAAGSRFIFRVRDLNPEARKYPPYLNLTKSRPHRGVLKDSTGVHGSFTETHAVRGHPGIYQVRAELFRFPGYWLVTPGTYHLQLQQIGAAGHLVYSPVETLTVR